MKILGYFDFNGNSVEDQFETASKLNVNGLFLRNVDNHKVNDFNDDIIKEILNAQRKYKIDVVALDPKIKSYDLYDAIKYEETIEKYYQAFEVASKLKINNVFFRLPVINNILDEFASFETQLKPLLDAARKQKITLVIYPEEEKTNTLVYILKKNNKKGLSVLYNPSQTVINGESPLVAYRLLKEYFEYFVASDIDKKDNPELIGYGRVNLIDLFKRLIRDNYKGSLVLDQSFAKFVQPEIEENEKKAPWYKRLFKRNKNIDNYLNGYRIRIFPNEENREVNIMDIYENQINVLNIAFKIRN